MKSLPAVLAFQRSLVVGDAIFYNVLEEGVKVPVPVVRHGIRGTQNQLKAEKAGVNQEAEGHVSNIQETDSAKLRSDTSILRIEFDVKGLDLSESLFACAHGAEKDDAQTFKKSLEQFLEKNKKERIEELACRVARNILNGRWLWRNRIAASSIVIRVTDSTKELLAEVDPFSIPFKEFGNYSEVEKKVAAVLARGFEGLKDEGDTTLYVEAELDFGVKGAEVFPSQKYLTEKGDKEDDSNVTRVLYTARLRDEEVAAFRDQKVANALRTFDTWYPEYAEVGRPIPIEPCGADLTDSKFYRSNTLAQGTNAYSLFLRLDKNDFTEPESLFLLSMLIRGGVFATKAAKEPAKPKKGEEANDASSE